MIRPTRLRRRRLQVVGVKQLFWMSLGAGHFALTSARVRVSVRMPRICNTFASDNDYYHFRLFLTLFLTIIRVDRSQVTFLPITMHVNPLI
jgi:hypothetical protein